MSAKPIEQRAGSAPARPDCDRPLLRLLEAIERLEEREATNAPGLSLQLAEMRGRLAGLAERAFASLSGWQTVQLARHPARPRLADYLQMMVRDFCELRGDRGFRDDPSIVTGFGRIGGRRVVLIGHNKGRTPEESAACCFGYPHPEGYRKALRAMKLAEKFDVPVVTLIDTPGAYPGVGAEERGIAQAIAVNLREMSRLRVPIVSVVIGEGGSGGALAIGVADRLAMMRHAYFSVITPEGCASILFHDASLAEEAANALRLTAGHLRQFELIDDVVEEPTGGAHRDPSQAAAHLSGYVRGCLDELRNVPREALLERRYLRLRRSGMEFREASASRREPTWRATGTDDA